MRPRPAYGQGVAVLRVKEGTPAAVARELSQAAAAAHEITIGGICRELDEAVQVAKAKGQPVH
jgi:hypothetical protein